MTNETKKMKCLVDLAYVDKDIPTGVSTFAIRLLRSLVDYKQDVEYSFLTNPRCDTYIKRLFPANKTYHIAPPHKRLVINFMRQHKNKLIIRKLYEEGKYDCLFVPFLTVWSSIPKGVNVVSVIHDVQPFILNSPLKNVFYKKLFLQNLTLSKSLITISNYTKEQLISLFDCCKGKTCVIYNSIDVGKVKKVDNPLFDKPFILNVNTLEEYKNQLPIVKAFGKIRKEIPHNLIFKGRRTLYWDKILFPLIERLNLQDRVFLAEDNLEYDQMNWLYSKADLFVNTSLMEGFGYTPIEAAINKTDVLTSKVTALRETTMGKLNYIDDPSDELEISNKIINLLQHPTPFSKRIEVAKVFIEKYSVQNQAKLYYQQLST